jgi:hypothetical protein
VGQSVYVSRGVPNSYFNVNDGRYRMTGATSSRVYGVPSTNARELLGVQLTDALRGKQLPTHATIMLSRSGINSVDASIWYTPAGLTRRLEMKRELAISGDKAHVLRTSGAVAKTPPAKTRARVLYRAH